MVILSRLQAKNPEPLLSYADDLFKQRKPDKGFITKREIYAGSVGREATKLCAQGHIYAVKKLVQTMQLQVKMHAISHCILLEDADWTNPIEKKEAQLRIKYCDNSWVNTPKMQHL